MTANEWCNQANTLISQALAAAQGEENGIILNLEESFLQLKTQQVPGVPALVETAFKNAMYALNDAIVGNVINDWDRLKSDLDVSARALGEIAASAKNAAALLSLQPVTDVANSLTAIVNDVKGIKANPDSADNIAQKIQDISDKLQQILKTANIA
jgi:hypothetical protein